MPLDERKEPWKVMMTSLEREDIRASRPSFLRTLATTAGWSWGLRRIGALPAGARP